MSNYSFFSAGDRSQSQATTAQRTAEAKAAFTASLNSVGANLDSELQSRAKNIHSNEKALTKQEKDVEKESKQLSKQSDSIQKLLDKSKKDIQSFDEISNLMPDLEADLALIEETLRLAEEGYESISEDEAHDNHERSQQSQSN